MDVAIEISETGPDIVIEGGDLRADEGLRTAALVSIFCDSRAADDEIPTGAEPRGWWAEDLGDEWGSKLWLLARGKRTEQTLQYARDYAARAFGWAVAQGVAQRVEVAADYGSQGELQLLVSPVRGVSRRWQGLWKAEGDRAADLNGVVIRLVPG